MLDTIESFAFTFKPLLTDLLFDAIKRPDEFERILGFVGLDVLCLDELSARMGLMWSST